MSNYVNSLYRDYEKLEIKNNKITKENKLLKLRLDILESENQRKDKIIAKNDCEISKKEDEINENEDITLEECPHCHAKELLELDSEITKDELYLYKYYKFVILSMVKMNSLCSPLTITKIIY